LAWKKPYGGNIIPGSYKTNNSRGGFGRLKYSENLVKEGKTIPQKGGNPLSGGNTLSPGGKRAFKNGEGAPLKKPPGGHAPKI